MPIRVLDLMSSLHSPSLAPMVSLSPGRFYHESPSVDSSSWGNPSSSLEKHLPTTKRHRGNPAPLKAVIFMRKTRSRSTQMDCFSKFIRNDRLCTQTVAESLNLVEENDRLCSKQGGVLVLDAAKGRTLGLDKNCAGSSIGEVIETAKNEAFDLNMETGGGIIQDRENGELCAKIVGNLRVGRLVKKIIHLPIEERVKILDLFESGRSLTIYDYNDILKALVKAGEYECAVNLFSEISCTATPNSWTFSIMVQCLCKKNQPDESKRILDDMVGRGFYPNVATFALLISCLCKRGRVKKAFEVFEIMNRVGHESSIRIYNSLIGGLCYVGRLEEALDLLKKMKNSSTLPDIYTYTLVIDAFCKVGRPDDAMELLKEAQEIGLVPNIVTYNSVLNGYCKEGRPLEGLHLLKEMQRGDCPPDFISYSIVLQGLLKCGEISAAWRTYKKLRDSGFQVEERAMNTLLRGVCRQPVIDERVLTDAMELFEEIIKIGHNPSPYTYSLMVQALAKGGEVDKALSHLHEMVRLSLPPRLMTYNIVLRILCGEGRCDDALDVFVLMIKADTIPSRFSFGILLNELYRQGRVLDTFGVYAAAIKRGVVPHWNPKNGFNVEKVFHQVCYEEQLAVDFRE